MIKSFFKDNPIHKKIVLYLDFIFLFFPVNYFLIWAPICLGMYIANTKSDLSSLWILAFNLKTGFLFLALSLIMASFFIKISNIGLEKNNYKFIDKYLFYFGFLFLFFTNIYNLILGLFFLVLYKFVFPKFLEDNKAFYNPVLNIAFCFLFILSGYAIVATNNSYFIIDINYLAALRILIYTVYTISVILMIDLQHDLKIVSYSRRLKILFSTLLITLNFILGIYLNDPFLSIASIVSLPFFLYALFRNLNKDIERSIIYPIFICNFFVSTIYPYLFIFLFIIFYISKYYYWHRFNFHYPTFLVKND